MVLFKGKREQNTDLDLFKKLFDKYYAKVYKTAFYILRNQQDAKDATQEAFITAYDKFHTLRDQSEFGSWICTIVANKAKEIYKARKKETLIDDINKVIPFIKENTGVKLPEEILQKKEFKIFIREQINELKPHYKQVIMLYYYNELSYREISEALEISIGTVKSRLNRAKNILKTEIINSTYRHVHN